MHLPTLVERKTDIPLLCAYFLEKFQSETGKNILSISIARALGISKVGLWKKMKKPGLSHET